MVYWYWLIVSFGVGCFIGSILIVILLAALGGPDRGDIDLTGRNLNGD